MKVKEDRLSETRRLLGAMEFLATQQVQQDFHKCYEIKQNDLLFIGKNGWPVEGIINKTIVTFIRRLLHTRKIMKYGVL